ncbi:STAS domain-containing protein [Fictibacillus norfolkensis]|uniref:STAS domain-containing protein n=1 Tax=Fictibacillus norfolkensis TaxID=2762233 RepID=A0ABR8SMT8_9BACL|nr:STAS domain-containing protein [Fictibacillus norfolkensis]MBD7964781.1 STAS domain-containing protein [Fictibacillus norfolkensis]
MDHNRVAFSCIGQVIVKNASLMAEKVLILRFKRHPIREKQPVHNETTITYIENFIKLLGQSLMMDQKEAESMLITWAEDTARFAVEYGQFLDAAIQPLAFIRSEILNVIKEVSLVEQFSILDVMDVINRIDTNIDHSSHRFSETYVENYRERENKHIHLLNELSVQVVPLFDGLGVLPLVGEVDETRAEVLRMKTLERCVQQNITSLVIDLSGVHTIDHTVLEVLFSLTDSLRLLGVRVTVTGIRPEIAIKAVQLKIEINQIHSFGNLKQALTSLGYKKFS